MAVKLGSFLGVHTCYGWERFKKMHVMGPEELTRLLGSQEVVTTNNVDSGHIMMHCQL